MFQMSIVPGFGDFFGLAADVANPFVVSRAVRISLGPLAVLAAAVRTNPIWIRRYHRFLQAQ
jgi:hypothetical protein